MKCRKDKRKVIICVRYQILYSQRILFSFQKNVKCLVQHMMVESTCLKSAGESLLQSGIQVVYIPSY